MTEQYLYHYYEHRTGPFKNLSDLSLEEATIIQDQLKSRNVFAGKRSNDYLMIRAQLEHRARELFIGKGGKPVRNRPHYMTIGECSWIKEWYTDGQELILPIHEFDPATISFTYGDLFPTMRYKDGKPYRGQVYTKEEIYELIDILGLPQKWNKEGNKGPERYIEAQIWDDKPLSKYIGNLK